MPRSIRAQFGLVAENYASSEFHADRDSLRALVELCQPQVDELVLDVATGTGHTALALAPVCQSVIGLDLTPEMLAQAKQLAQQRQLSNVAWVEGDAQNLPFPDQAFDLYTARAAPHHFPELDKALQEAHRVLKSGGKAIFVDCSPPPFIRDYLHQIELKRDPTHVRSYTLEEWQEHIERADFVIETLERREIREWDFESWLGKMNVAEAEVAQLKEQFLNAPPKVKQALNIDQKQGKLTHSYWHAYIRARKPWG